MKSVPLSKYYHRGALIPFYLTLIIGIILGLSHRQDPNYSSEYFSNDGYVESITLLIIGSLILAILSLTILLNHYDFISRNIFLSMVTWMFLPLSVAFNQVYKHIHFLVEYSDKYEGNRALDTYLILIAASHATGLILTFIQFRKSRPLG